MFAVKLGLKNRNKFIILINPFGRFVLSSIVLASDRRRKVCVNYTSFLSEMDECRVKVFLGFFYRNGKRLRARLLLCNLLLLIRFRFRCFNPLFLLVFVIRLLEPLFELRNIKRKNNKLQVVSIVSPKRKIALASGFIYDSVLDTCLKQKRKSLFLNILCEEFYAIILGNKNVGSYQRYRRHNFFVRKSRFSSFFGIKHAGKISK